MIINIHDICNSTNDKKQKNYGNNLRKSNQFKILSHNITLDVSK